MAMKVCWQRVSGMNLRYVPQLTSAKIQVRKYPGSSPETNHLLKLNYLKDY